ncbi:MAG: RHS repeat-associated core domain-containing protein, partial [Thermoanaerobaculia bacterium]|nr:RHS repeat-associated core domain-containing protein [Thermoanaerobaculia bacterium]
GRPVDTETGLMYFRNRYYDPEAGIFVTADPLGYIDGPSMYAFARFDPVNRSDPMGLNSGRSDSSGPKECGPGTGKSRDICLQRGANSGVGGFDPVEYINNKISDLGDYLIEKGYDPLAVACYMAETEFPDNANGAVIEAGIGACGGKVVKEVGGLAVKGVQKLAQKKADEAADVVGETAVDDVVEDLHEGIPTFRVQGGVLPNASKVRFSVDDAGQLSIKGDDMLFVNVNQEQRAVEFLARRGETASLIRFDLSPEFVEKLRKMSVRQNQGRLNPTLPQRVDETVAPDQFGIPSNMFDELLDNVVPGSVRVTTQ